MKTTRITLDNHPAVLVRDEDWPIIGGHEWHDSEDRAHAKDRAYVRVRACKDGRVIVYGMLKNDGTEYRCGLLVEGTKAMTAAVEDIANRVGLFPSDVFHSLPKVAL